MIPNQQTTTPDSIYWPPVVVVFMLSVAFSVWTIMDRGVQRTPTAAETPLVVAAEVTTGDGAYIPNP